MYNVVHIVSEADGAIEMQQRGQFQSLADANMFAEAAAQTVSSKSRLVVIDGAILTSRTGQYEPARERGK